MATVPLDKNTGLVSVPATVTRTVDTLTQKRNGPFFAVRIVTLTRVGRPNAMAEWLDHGCANYDTEGKLSKSPSTAVT